VKTGIFHFLVNHAAFIDRAVISAWPDCTVRKSPLTGVANTGILRPGGFYARCLRGNWRITENPVQVLYGKACLFKRVPPLSITLRSENVPLSGAQAQICLREILAATGHRVELSLIELTFDSDRISVEDFDRFMVYRARTCRQLKDWQGSRTIYVGSPSSPWQARIYQKTDDIVRLEFILKRHFLQEYGMRHLSDVALVRCVPIEKMLSLRSFSRRRLWAATTRWTNHTGRRLLSEWWERHSELRTLSCILRDNGVDFKTVLTASRKQHMYENMLRNVIW
jgi:hypothetical protein